MSSRSVVLAIAACLALLATACATMLVVEAPAVPQAAAADADPTPLGQPDSGPLVATSGVVSIAGRFEWTDAACEFAEPPSVATNCGWLEVPERWDDPADTDTIRLHVGVFSAGPQTAEPVVYLEGGPGGDALANIAQSFDVLFGTLVDVHDIVIIGQRGTGSAEPTLACPNVAELDLELLDDVLDDVADDEYRDAYTECASDLLDDGIDPSAYNSVQNAHDVEALRLALGYERWNLLGISYGTRLGQTLMRLHPEGVRAAILDSVLALEREPTFDIPTVAKRAFETLFAECTASAVCSTAYPDLETRLFDLVDRLDADPVFFTVADVITGERYPAALNGTGLLDVVFSSLYSKSSIAGLPELVEQLESGETSGIETLISQEVSSLAFFAEGMYWSVECHEEVPFLGPGSDVAGQTGVAHYDRLVSPDNADFVATVCEAFDAGEAAPIEDELLVSDIPTLLLAGVYDPITPPADTESLLAGLPGGQYVEFPHTGHAAMTDECAQEVALAFLRDPAAVADAACVAEIEPPDWTPDLFGELAFEPFVYDGELLSGSGVAPVGWTSAGDGTFVLSDNSLHVSVILQQVVQGEIGDLLVQNVGGFLGFDPIELAAVEAGGSSWRHLEAASPGSVFDLFVAERDGATLFVLLQHAPRDRDAALESLTTPILEAMGS